MQPPTTTDVQAELERFKQDRVWFQEHYDELLAQHPEQWVAIYNQRVAGDHPDYDQLLDLLAARDVPSEHAFIEKVTANDELLILRA